MNHNQAHPRIFLSSPTMNGHELPYIQEAFDSNWVAPLGKNVDEFEQELASYVGVPYAAALNAGTAALHLAVKLSGVGQGDIVFCSSLTFAASCNPILYEKATPVFIDSESDTWNMSPDGLREAFKRYPNAKAVIVVNLYGTPAKLKEIREICGEHGAVLIEDAAESLGATYQGKQTGSFGDYGVFSFNGNKIITSSGGGMLVSRNEEGIKKARFWATQARDAARHYQHSEIGYNYRMSNVVAGIGRGQLKTLEEYKRKKQRIYDYYKNALKHLGLNELELNPMNMDGEANNWLSCVTVKTDGVLADKIRQNEKQLGLSAMKDQIMDALDREHIESRPIWKPMQLQPLYKECGFVQVESRNGKSISEDVFDRGLCLPSDIKNSDEDMERIIGVIHKAFRNHR